MKQNNNKNKKNKQVRKAEVGFTDEVDEEGRSH